jgi:hypothetical protein
LRIEGKVPAGAPAPSQFRKRTVSGGRSASTDRTMHSSDSEIGLFIEEPLLNLQMFSPDKSLIIRLFLVNNEAGLIHRVDAGGGGAVRFFGRAERAGSEICKNDE